VDRRARLQLTLTTAALCAAVVVLAAVASAGGRQEGLLLPDLVQRPPDDIQVSRGDDGAVDLGFGSGVVNAGAGPLSIEGRRPPGQEQMSATQIVRREDGGVLRRRRTGVLRFTVEEGHRHWHLLRFDRYTLREAGDERIVVADRKTGFCLGDRFEAGLSARLPGVPAQPPYTRNCGLGRPDLRRITEGISVGYGDDYGAFLEGQYLPIAGLPAGDYDLVHHVNAERLLLEQRYDNNTSCLRLRITWPRGPEALPRVERRGACRAR
jgi:hypothetical protein